jgi:hypothetical protein
VLDGAAADEYRYGLMASVSDIAPVELAAGLVDAIAVRDFDAIERLLAEDARLRAVVPSRVREEEGRDAVLGRMRFWWEAFERLDLLDSELEELEGRVRFRYRLRGVDGDGWMVQEQAGFVDAEGGRIVRIDLVCSGNRPIPPPD